MIRFVDMTEAVETGRRCAYFDTVIDRFVENCVGSHDFTCLDDFSDMKPELRERCLGLTPGGEDFFREDATRVASEESKVQLVCSRCEARVERSYEPGRCYAEDCEPPEMDSHDEAQPAEPIEAER